MHTTNNSLKKLVALFSIGVLCTYGLVFACADFFVEYDYDSNFTPEVYVDESYSPLFFSSGEVFYRIGFDEANTTRFNDAIVGDWSTYISGKLTKDQLVFLILNDSSATAVNEWYTAIQKKQKPTTSLKNIDVTDLKVKSLIEFLYYAKKIEASCTASQSSWDYSEYKPSPVDAKTIAIVEKLYAETTDEFLKNRYWFQAMKANFYSANKANVLAFFDKTKAGVPQNTLYYRGVAYVAGAYYSKKDYTTSNYFYSLVFDKCQVLRTVAAYNFHPQEQKDFQSALALTRTADEKSALWALLGYYSDEKKAIQEIYKINPKSEHVEYLLTRLVNKEESAVDAIGFKTIEEYKEKRKTQSKATLEFVTTIAKEGKTRKPYLWNIAAGYLNIFGGNYTEATQFIDKAEKLAPKSNLSTQQIRLFRFLNALAGTTKMDEKSENKLLPELNWLYFTCTKVEGGEFRYLNALMWSKQYIAALYNEQQNAVLSELFNHNQRYYQRDSDLELMKTFLSKPTKSPWEKLALGIYGFSLQDVYEYQAVINAYTGNLDRAITLMEQAKDSKDDVLLGNPFNGKIKDCHDCDHAAVQKVAYTKLSLLKKLKEMQLHVEKGEDLYNNCLLLGNAFYNITYYGNARVFYDGSIMEQGGTNYIDKDYTSYLLSCSQASKYYQQAFDAAINPEQKAKCAYMLAKCERNEFYTKGNYHTAGFYDEPEVNFLAWNGFKKLKSDYSNTRYYRDVLNECGYFKKYVETK